jgi:hypothetical protein
MLYPFSLTLDLYIQAESFEEAKKLAEAYVKRGASLLRYDNRTY